MPSIFEGKDTKKNRRQYLQSIFLVVALGALVLTVSGASMPLLAFAATVNPDPALSCGKKYWGIDNQDNPTWQNLFLFGHSPTTCQAVNPAWPSGTTTTNYVKLSTQNSAAKTFAMQGAAMGNKLSPWDFQVPPDTKPNTYPTPGFPVDPNHNFNFKTQWVWTRELLPNSGNQDNHMHAQMMMHLVMQKTGETWTCTSTTPCNFITIDYILDNLVDSGNTWNQWAYSGDADSAAYGQNSDNSKCTFDGVRRIYTMGIVLDNTSTSVNQWQNKIFNIGPSITSSSGAFGNHYSPQGTGCLTDPGTISQYQIKSMALTNEIFSDGPSYLGAFRGGFSWGELYY